MEDDPSDRVEQVVHDDYRRTPEPSANLRERILRKLDEHDAATRRGVSWKWWWRPATLRLAPAGTLAAAGLLVAAGVWIGSVGQLHQRPAKVDSSATNVATRASAEIASASGARTAGSAGRAAGSEVAFMLVAPGVTRVALVGEFNGWDPLATPLVRVGRDGPWVTTLALPPGRHVYGFVLDGSRWMPDPRAPLAPDEGFGVLNSVVVVGQDGSL